MQMLCYCMLVEDVMEGKVSHGYIFYIRDGNRQVGIAYNTGLKHKILSELEKILDIIQNERMPKPTDVKTRCIDCTYKNICVR